MASTDPADRQKAIDLAVDHFKINTEDVESITYDKNLSGEGTAQTVNGRGVIKIGESAFDGSFGRLGSVIGHEVGVHFQIHQRQGIALDENTPGGILQEIDALQFEIDQQSRFGQTPSEIQSVRDRIGIKRGNYQQLLRQQRMDNELQRNLEYGF